MAKISYITIPPELEAPYKACLRPGDRFIFSRIVRKNPFISRVKKTLLLQKQIIVECAATWKSFSQEVRDLWIEMAAYCGLRGYNYFVQDEAYRIRYGIPGHSDPVAEHQYKVGRIIIQDPATEIRIAQFHPSSYYVQKKVQGTKSQYNPVQVNEPFSLPLTISISYEANLQSAGAEPTATFYAEIYHNYQGNTLTTRLKIPLSLSQEWTTEEVSLSSVIGVAIGYNLYIDIHDCTGELRFDNVKAVHNSTNWVRDFRCNNIDQSFTRQYYQVPRNWVPQIISDDAFFDSVYPT